MPVLHCQPHAIRRKLNVHILSCVSNCAELSSSSVRPKKLAIRVAALIGEHAALGDRKRQTPLALLVLKLLRHRNWVTCDFQPPAINRLSVKQAFAYEQQIPWRRVGYL